MGVVGTHLIKNKKQKMTFKDLKNVAISISIVAPFFVAIWLIDMLSDKFNWFQTEYGPLLYIVPILVVFVVFMLIKTRD